MGEPLPLTAGKRAWNLFEAGSKFHPMLRSQDHRGVCVFHLASDRAVLAPLDHMFRQRHAAYYTEGIGPDLGPEGPLLALTDLVVSTACTAHDVQHSLKWGLANITPAEIVNDVHIVVESLRNSFSLLHCNLRMFLVQHISFDSSGDGRVCPRVLADLGRRR